MELEGKRLNKYISDCGIASRREADHLIEAGKVTIRRRSRKDEPDRAPFTASVGERVYPGDTVTVNGKELPKKEAEKVYYLYHKPRGVICTCDRNIPENIIDAVGIRKRVTYAGRLDKDSSGLIILTNDGEFNDRMMRASGFHEKEYLCSVDRPVTAEFLKAMADGVKILLDDDETLRKNPNGQYVKTRPCTVHQTGERKFTIILTQGYNRQIRRMCRALGYGVNSIERIRIMNVKLDDLKPGEVRRMLPEEVEKIRRNLGKGSSASSERMRQYAKR